MALFFSVKKQIEKQNKKSEINNFGITKMDKTKFL